MGVQAQDIPSGASPRGCVHLDGAGTVGSARLRASLWAKLHRAALHFALARRSGAQNGGPRPLYGQRLQTQPQPTRFTGATFSCVPSCEDAARSNAS